MRDFVHMKYRTLQLLKKSVVLVLCLVCIATCVSLKSPPLGRATKRKSMSGGQPTSTLRGPGILGSVDDVGQNTDPPRRATPLSKDRCDHPRWILWAGDSNMRHTFHTWIKQHTKKAKTVFKSDPFSADPGAAAGEGRRWADQEAVLEFHNGDIMRASFRFLHGSTSEFLYMTDHWDEARVYTPFEDQNQTTFTRKNGLEVDLDAVNPSAYALRVTQQGTAVDYSKSSPLLGVALEEFQGTRPEVVVLTEGWGGVPYCSYYKNMESRVFSPNKDTFFVWAPIYVTNHDVPRHACFEEEFSMQSPSERSPNLSIVDLWDISAGLGGTIHTPIGGKHMQTAIQRLEAAWCAVF